MNPFFLDKSADFGALPGFRGDVQIYKANDLNLDMANIACTIIEVGSYLLLLIQALICIH